MPFVTQCGYIGLERYKIRKGKSSCLGNQTYLGHKLLNTHYSYLLPHSHVDEVSQMS